MRIRQWVTKLSSATALACLVLALCGVQACQHAPEIAVVEIPDAKVLVFDPCDPPGGEDIGLAGHGHGYDSMPTGCL